MYSDDDIKAMTALLVDWYEKNKRDLPWRKDQDPYHIWLSEIMAQQTQIATVIPYYQRFLALYPSLEDLAQAPLDDVLKVWQGLGYYSRARLMHRAAQMIVGEYNGVFPDKHQDLLNLPGLGPYTAAALASIAFNERRPAVDGNVKRLAARLLAAKDHVQSRGLSKQAYDLVDRMMAYGPPPQLTQGLMELGALVCRPKAPSCQACPLAAFCRAKETGQTASLPVKAPAKIKKRQKKTVLLVENDKGQVLVKKRQERLLSGMYQYLLLDGHLGEEDLEEALSKLGCRLKSCQGLKPYTHVFTHLVWEFEAYHCLVAAFSSSQPYVFVDREALEKLAIPRAFSPLSQRLKDVK